MTPVSNLAALTPRLQQCGGLGLLYIIIGRPLGLGLDANLAAAALLLEAHLMRRCRTGRTRRGRQSDHTPALFRCMHIQAIGLVVFGSRNASTNRHAHTVQPAALAVVAGWCCWSAILAAGCECCSK